MIFPQGAIQQFLLRLIWPQLFVVGNYGGAAADPPAADPPAADPPAAAPVADTTTHPLSISILESSQTLRVQDIVPEGEMVSISQARALVAHPSASKSATLVAKESMSFSEVPWVPSQKQNQAIAIETEKSIRTENIEKMEKAFRTEKKVVNRQSKATVSYSIGQYVNDSSVNVVLRNGGDESGMAAMLNLALNLIPLKYPWACVRGRNCTPAEADEMKFLHESGEPFLEKGFTSACAVPFHFRSGRLIVPFCIRKDEWEVLFKSGTKFRLLSFEDSGVDESGRYKIVMKEVME